MKKRIISIIALTLAATTLLCACSKKRVVSSSTQKAETTAEQSKQTTLSSDSAKETSANTTSAVKPTYADEKDAYFAQSGNVVSISKENYISDQPIVMLKLEDRGYITIAAYPENAPETVNNFLTLVSSGSYDAVSFWGFDSKFGIMSDPNPQSYIGLTSDYSIKNELKDKMIVNHSDEVLFMDKSGNSGNSSGYRFFITTNERYQADFDENLHKNYVAVGEVIDGLDVLYDIASEANFKTASITPPVIIVKAVVDLRGYELKAVTKITDK